MGEPDKRGRQRRRPTLRSALAAATGAGMKVRSAMIEGERVVLIFNDGSEATGGPETDWDKRIEELKRDKH